MGINVAITGLHASDNPAPGIGVIRSLKHPNGWDGKIIGLAYDVMDTGIYDEELLDHTYLIPYPNTSSAFILERILYIHDQHRIDVIIPTLDSELGLYQSIETQLKEAGISVFLPKKEVSQKVKKSVLTEFCEENGIHTPKTIIIKSPEEIDDAIDELKLPLMVKGVFYEAVKCRTKTDVLCRTEEMKTKWGYPIIFQEVLDADEFDVCCVADRDGNLMGAVPIRKTRLTDKGKAWAAITLKNDELYKLSQKIIKTLKWSGPCELEILQDRKTKDMHLLEINPRFPAWVFLCTGAEQNLPKLVIDLALNKPVHPLPPAKSGVTFVRHATDLVCPIEWLEKLTTHGELHYK